MKGIIAIFATLIVLAAGTHCTGLVDYGRLYQRLTPLLRQAKILDHEPRHIVIGLDITAGREQELGKDWEAIGRIVREARVRDRIEVYLIHSRAEAEQEALLTVQMPPTPGPAGSKLRRAKQEAEQSWYQAWVQVEHRVKDKDKKQQTDLIGFLRYCVYQNPAFQRHQHPYLILFTDGQQVGDGFNFERKAPSELELRSMTEGGFLPDLGNITLRWVGMTSTHRISNSHWRQIQTFWIAYCRAGGARSVMVSSSRDLHMDDGSPSSFPDPTGIRPPALLSQFAQRP